MMSRSAFSLDRRKFLRGSGLFALAGLGGCMFDQGADTTATSSVVYPGFFALRPQIGVDSGVTDPDIMYTGVQENGFQLPAVPYEKIPRQF
jgi:hypothetical protein